MCLKQRGAVLFILFLSSHLSQDVAHCCSSQPYDTGSWTWWNQADYCIVASMASSDRATGSKAEAYFSSTEDPTHDMVDDGLCVFFGIKDAGLARKKRCFYLTGSPRIPRNDRASIHLVRRTVSRASRQGKYPGCFHAQLRQCSISDYLMTTNESRGSRLTTFIPARVLYIESAFFGPSVLAIRGPCPGMRLFCTSSLLAVKE